MISKGNTWETPKPSITFSVEGEPAFRIEWDGSISLETGVTIPQAARAFWNCVAQMRGQPPLFPEEPAEAAK